MDSSLQNLIGAVRRRAPDLVDEWEATAWIESFGWTDERIRAQFRLADTRALGRIIYEQSQQTVARPMEYVRPEPTEKPLVMVAAAYSRTLVYALPWLVMFGVESMWPDAFESQPELAGPIAIAVMASLIATGGYVQAIARQGSFYLGMEQIALVKHASLLLCRTGLASAVILALAGLAVGGYFAVFDSAMARAVSAFYFVMLSLLWLTCAMLSLQSPRWRVPVVFLAAAMVFVGARTYAGASVLAAQSLALVAAVVAALLSAVEAFRGVRRRDTRTEVVRLPRLPVMLQGLLPYFLYGTSYFTFLFADRLAAGSAVPAISGLPFGIAADYKNGIDLAFLVFLIVAGAVECGNLALMQCWRRDALRFAAGPTALEERLLRRRAYALCAIVAVFAAVGITTAVVAADRQFLTTAGHVVFVTGSAGYALFAIGLLDALTLFSVNRPTSVLSALVPALVINLAVGYVLSHVAGAEYAVVGLVCGAAFFALRVRRGVREAMRRPDFAIAWA